MNFSDWIGLSHEPTCNPIMMIRNMRVPPRTRVAKGGNGEVSNKPTIVTTPVRRKLKMVQDMFLRKVNV